MQHKIRIQAKNFETQELFKKIICFIFAMISTLSLNMRNTLYIGDCPESKIGNIFARIYSMFDTPDATEIIIFLALHLFFLWGLKNYKRISISGIIISGLLAVMYVLSVFYKKYNSTEYIWCDSFQLFAAMLEILGIGLIIYFLLISLEGYFKVSFKLFGEKQGEQTDGFWKKHFFAGAFVFIFLCWFVWLIVTYPGSTNPDGIAQLKDYFGDVPRSAWHPPLSTLIMGGLFDIGQGLINANFGFFSYNLFQGIVGALVFAYSLSRLVKRGAPFVIPVVGTVFFGLMPMWGAYVQWFEKDFLYTVSVVLFVTFIAEILLEKDCTGKMLICICFSGIVMALLRNNGIFAIVPTLIGCSIYIKGAGRKRVLSALAIVLVVYEIIVRGIYPAMGIAKTSISETIGFMFQATARYVQEYPEELTEHETEVISQNFQSVDNLGNYNPRIIDPVKIYYNHSDFNAYLQIWIDMFFKHPMVYVESYLNGSYGYMAPVSTDVGAYIALGDYDPYLKELGLSHVNNGNLNYAAARVLNLNNGLPLVRYLASPGLYTWLTLVALWIMLKNRKAGWILLIPNLVNILVCTASPLADAMRYALPTVAVMPFIIGWIFLNFRNESFKGDIVKE